MRRFPDGFLWGVAGAGHQTEGDNTTSDTWFAENVRPAVFVEPSGKACNGYALWREDVDLAGMGLTAYRFSVEWAVRAGGGRVLGRGAGPLRGDRRPVPRTRGWRRS